MVMSNSLTEKEIRSIVRDEISQVIPEFEIVKDSQLTAQEIQLCSEAEEEYKRGETLSFEEVYEKVLKK